MIVVGLLVATAAVAVLGPGPRRSAARDQARARSRSLGTGPVDLPGLLLGVAARLRAGVDPALAWAAVSPAWSGPPSAEELTAALGTDRRPRHRWVRRRANREVDVALHAVLVALAVAEELGAPLAPVLEAMARTASDRADEASARSAALAGPRATARVLGWLPLAGLLVAAAMGARPWDALTDGGAGTTAGAAGLLLLLLGRAWTARLVRRAERAGEEP